MITCIATRRLCSQSLTSWQRAILSASSWMNLPRSMNRHLGNVDHPLYLQTPQRFAAVQSKVNVHTSSKDLSQFEDRQTKALTVWKNVKEVGKSPIPALTLGLGGLVPFVGVPLYTMFGGCFLPHLATAQLVYGATILSFLGGVRWGFTIPEENPIEPNWVNLGYSVTPALVAWTSLLLPTPFSLFTLMGGLLFAGYMDMAMFGYPPWFKGLRFTLTVVAVISLWTMYMCSWMLPTTKSNLMIEADTKEK